MEKNAKFIDLLQSQVIFKIVITWKQRSYGIVHLKVADCWFIWFCMSGYFQKISIYKTIKSDLNDSRVI